MKMRTTKKGARSAAARVPVLIRGRAVSRTIRQAGYEWLKRAWSWIQALQQARMANKSLRVGENVSLGMKRFVAIVKVGEQRFLVGGGGNDVSLLACLAGEQKFQEVLSASAGKPAAAVVPKVKTRASRARTTGAEKCA